MLALFRVLLRLSEVILAVPVWIGRTLTAGIVFNPRLGALRYVVWGAVGYLIFALGLVYVVAPIRGVTGAHFMADKLRYDAERWLATAVYDARGNFVGTFDPRLDSRRDVNYTDAAIGVGSYTANPDHKSIPVRDVPVLVGSGSTSEVWAQNIHATQVGVPLAAALLKDLEIHSRKNPAVAAISIKPGASKAAAHPLARPTPLLTPDAMIGDQQLRSQ